MPTDTTGGRTELDLLRVEAERCTGCDLHTTRDRVVFGSGAPDAELMFIGEAPGAEEDRTGEPFVGRSGSLLTQLLDEIDLSRDQVYIANVIKCHPPGNRDPAADEIAACRGYLVRQAELVAPKLVCSLGNFATRLLTGEKTGITKLHGIAREVRLGDRELTLYPLFHPAAALRSPDYARGLRDDFRRIPGLLANGGPK